MMSPKSFVATEAVELQAQQFMDDWHLGFLQSTLGRSWDQEQAAKAALELFVVNGVDLSEEEIADLAAHPAINNEI